MLHVVSKACLLPQMFTWSQLIISFWKNKELLWILNAIQTCFVHLQSLRACSKLSHSSRHREQVSIWFIWWQTLSSFSCSTSLRWNPTLSKSEKIEHYINEKKTYKSKSYFRLKFDIKFSYMITLLVYIFFFFWVLHRNKENRETRCWESIPHLPSDLCLDNQSVQLLLSKEEYSSLMQASSCLILIKGAR